MDHFIVSTQDQLEDHKVMHTFGLISGSTVRSRSAASNYFSGIRTIFGGEIAGYTKVVAESREQALDRLVDRAKQLGANAVLAVRITTTEVNNTCSEVLAYGTAVKVARLD